MVTGANRAQFGGTIFNSVIEDHCVGENISVFHVKESTDLSEPVVHSMKMIVPRFPSHPIGIY